MKKLIIAAVLCVVPSLAFAAPPQKLTFTNYSATGVTNKIAQCSVIPINYSPAAPTFYTPNMAAARNLTPATKAGFKNYSTSLAGTDFILMKCHASDGSLWPSKMSFDASGSFMTINTDYILKWR